MSVVYKPGDYVKVEFPEPVTEVGDGMWVSDGRCDKAVSCSDPEPHETGGSLKN